MVGSARTRTPCSKNHGQISPVHAVVSVDISWAALAGSPGAKNDGQISAVDATRVIKVPDAVWGREVLLQQVALNIVAVS